MNTPSRATGFRVLLLFSGMVGAVEGFVLAYIVSQNPLYAALAVGGSLLLACSSVAAYAALRHVPPYTAAGIPFAHHDPNHPSPEAPPTPRTNAKELVSAGPPLRTALPPTLGHTDGSALLLDVITDATTIRVVVDLPTVRREDIAVTCSERRLTIATHTAAGMKTLEVELPTPVESTIERMTFTHGVLDVTVTKMPATKPVTSARGD